MGDQQRRRRNRMHFVIRKYTDKKENNGTSNLIDSGKDEENTKKDIDCRR